MFYQEQQLEENININDEHNCQLCTDHIKPIQILENRMQTQYFQAFNFYFSKPVNEILANIVAPHVVSFKDYLYYDDENEYLKRYYNKQEIDQRIDIVTEFYNSPENNTIQYTNKPFSPNILSVDQHKIIQKNVRKKLKLEKKRRIELEQKIQQQQKELQNLESSQHIQDEQQNKNNINLESLLKENTNCNNESSEIQQNSYINPIKELGISFETEVHNIYYPELSVIQSEGGVDNSTGQALKQSDGFTNIFYDQQNFENNLWFESQFQNSQKTTNTNNMINNTQSMTNNSNSNYMNTSPTFLNSKFNIQQISQNIKRGSLTARGGSTIGLPPYQKKQPQILDDQDYPNTDRTHYSNWIQQQQIQQQSMQFQSLEYPFSPVGKQKNNNTNTMSKKSYQSSSQVQTQPSQMSSFRQTNNININSSSSKQKKNIKLSTNQTKKKNSTSNIKSYSNLTSTLQTSKSTSQSTKNGIRKSQIDQQQQYIRQSPPKNQNYIQTEKSLSKPKDYLQQLTYTLFSPQKPIKSHNNNNHSGKILDKNTQNLIKKYSNSSQQQQILNSFTKLQLSNSNVSKESKTQSISNNNTNNGNNISKSSNSQKKKNFNFKLNLDKIITYQESINSVDNGQQNQQNQYYPLTSTGNNTNTNKQQSSTAIKQITPLKSSKNQIYQTTQSQTLREFHCIKQPASSKLRKQQTLKTQNKSVEKYDQLQRKYFQQKSINSPILQSSKNSSRRQYLASEITQNNQNALKNSQVAQTTTSSSQQNNGLNKKKITNYYFKSNSNNFLPNNNNNVKKKSLINSKSKNDNYYKSQQQAITERTYRNENSGIVPSYSLEFGSPILNKNKQKQPQNSQHSQQQQKRINSMNFNVSDMKKNGTNSNKNQQYYNGNQIPQLSSPVKKGSIQGSQQLKNTSITNSSKQKKIIGSINAQSLQFMKQISQPQTHRELTYMKKP